MSEYIRVMQISNPRTENEIRKTANRTEKGTLFPCTVMLANSNPFTYVLPARVLVKLQDKDHAMSTTRFQSKRIFPHQDVLDNKQAKSYGCRQDLGN